MRRRDYLTSVAGIGATVGIAGCSGDGGSGGDPTETDSSGGSGGGGESDGSDGGGGQSMSSTQLAEAYYPLIPQSVQTQVGVEKGFFEENGVEIEDITSFQGGGTTVRGITTGGLGAGAGALAAVVQAFLAGAPIQLAGLLVAKSFTEFHTQLDSDVESIQDVAGGTIAVTNPGSTSEASAIRAIQNTDGITLDDVEITPAGGLGESITMLKEGNATVAVTFPPRSTIMNENNESRLVWKTTEKAPGIMDRVLMMGTPTFQEEPELAQGLGQAFVQSMEYVRNNIEESAEVYASNNDLPEGIPLKVLKDINPKENYRIGIKESKVKAVGETMIEQGLIDEQPPWKDVITQSHLPEEHQVDWLK